MTRRLERATSECAAPGCSFTASGVGALGNAARHYDSTGHPIKTTITNVVTYGDTTDHERALEAAGQQRLHAADAQAPGEFPDAFLRRPEAPQTTLNLDEDPT